MFNRKEFKYIILNKPYGVLCQFTDRAGRRTLSDLGNFPKDVYPAGRLDYDSEGLVLLTNDKRLINFLLHPKHKHPRTYLVQVERIPDPVTLDKLRAGVIIEGKRTLPAEVRLLKTPPEIWEREIPIRYRKNVPTSWLELTIYEGRNRQVRKMTAAVGHPTLRLVRIKIGNVKLGNLKPGEHRELNDHEIEKLRSHIL
ncbi:MAG: Ribosomal large subunit pseudouridine synthase E [Ignavibacteriae bacterium]|nr:MAG: Ribosomal large subunit pseudouridine synthase E [Ignavibacteriota bacterium]